MNPAPPLWQKILRVAAFAFLGGFLTGLLPIAEEIAQGRAVDFNLLGAALLGVFSGAIAGAIRAVIGVLPVFADDPQIIPGPGGDTQP